MFCYLTLYIIPGVFELILKGSSQKSQLGSQARIYCSFQRGHILTVTHVFFKDFRLVGQMSQSMSLG